MYEVKLKLWVISARFWAIKILLKNCTSVTRPWVFTAKILCANWASVIPPDWSKQLMITAWSDPILSLIWEKKLKIPPKGYVWFIKLFYICASYYWSEIQKYLVLSANWYDFIFLPRRPSYCWVERYCTCFQYVFAAFMRNFKTYPMNKKIYTAKLVLSSILPFCISFPNSKLNLHYWPYTLLFRLYRWKSKHHSAYPTRWKNAIKQLWRS